jgi:hypothetical protein
MDTCNSNPCHKIQNISRSRYVISLCKKTNLFRNDLRSYPAKDYTHEGTSGMMSSGINYKQPSLHLNGYLVENLSKKLFCVYS